MTKRDKGPRAIPLGMALLMAHGLFSGCGGEVKRPAPDILTVSATEITLTAPANAGSCHAASQKLTITNQWKNPIAWEISGAPGWLLVNPQSGTLDPRQEGVASLSLDCQDGIWPQSALLFVTALDLVSGSVGAVARVTVKKQHASPLRGDGMRGHAATWKHPKPSRWVGASHDSPVDKSPTATTVV